MYIFLHEHANGKEVPPRCNQIFTSTYVIIRMVVIIYFKFLYSYFVVYTQLYFMKKNHKNILHSFLFERGMLFVCLSM